MSCSNLKNIFAYLLPLSFCIACHQQTDSISSTDIEMMPDSGRFKIEVIAQSFVDPTEIAVAPNGDVFITERKGKLYFYSAHDRSLKTIGALSVNLGHEDGLLGLALDPNYHVNHWIYMLYTPNPHREQRVSRFTIKNNALNVASEKVIITYPIVAERHQGGSLAFDNYGNLLISTGENTKPTDINGHAPLDERQGHEINDSQRSAGNTNDLRGKILRIHPNPDGSYSIPEGNLFAPNTPLARPEIFIMGCRNPFRIAIDSKTNTLYWGDIGPDAGDDTFKGPRGYDEINKTAVAGNFGWPYFIADNKKYTKVDPQTQQIVEEFDVLHPANNSPNNTGLKSLPPAQPAWIWYPYQESSEFPMLGTGGRTAIAGGVYHFSSKSKDGLPRYYDGQLFIGDWMRNFVKTVKQTKVGKIDSITSFLPNNKFIRPMDMQFGKDGCLYILEYGSNWFDNTDARLTKISYQRGNLAPVAKATASIAVGAAPLKVDFSSNGTYDVDGDKIIYEWRFDDGLRIQSKKKNPSFLFLKPGNFMASLTATDIKGNSSKSEISIQVGNTPPKITIDYPRHGTFYWTGDTIPYIVTAVDAEDGSVASGAISVSKKTFFNGGNVLQPNGDKLIQGSDCKACHQTDAKSVGPSFTEISHKYAGISDVQITDLSKKIINGGTGVWGSYVMSAHPQLGIEEAKEMIKYILAITSTQPMNKNNQLISSIVIPNGMLNSKLSYGLEVTAKDKGYKGQPAITSTVTKVLKPAILQAKYNDGEKDIINSGTYARMPFPTSYVSFKKLDLKNVKSISLEYSYDFFYPNCVVECRLDNSKGKLLGKVVLQKKTDEAKDLKITFAVEKSEGLHDIYFLYKPDLTIHAPLNLNYIYFNR